MKPNKGILLFIPIVFIFLSWGCKPLFKRFKPLRVILVTKSEKGWQDGVVNQKASPTISLAVLLQYQTSKGIFYTGGVDQPCFIQGKKVHLMRLPNWVKKKLRFRFTYVTLEPEKIHYTVTDKVPSLRSTPFPLDFGYDLWQTSGLFKASNTSFLSHPPCGRWLGEALGCGTLRFGVRLDVISFYDPDKKITLYSTPFDHPEGALTVLRRPQNLPEPLPFYASFANLPSLAFAPNTPDHVKPLIHPFFHHHQAYSTVLWLLLPSPDARGVPFTYPPPHPLRWGEDLHPGDSLLFEDLVIIFYQDAGKERWLDGEDLVWADLEAPLVVCSLKAVLPRGGDGVFFCPHGAS